jgi:carbamoyltransferase
MTHAYWGPEYGDFDYQAALRAAGLRYTRYGDDALAKAVVRGMVDGHIVAWFDGRAEVGPHALGARGLLADPRRRATAARVNQLSGRETWRPVGSSVLADHADEYFLGRHMSPFKNVSLRIRKEVRHQVPALGDVDGMTDTHVVGRGEAARFHELLAEFRRQTGVPLVVNASWRPGGEPVVNTPAEAIGSFLAADIGLLVLGNNLVSKVDQAG